MRTLDLGTLASLIRRFGPLAILLTMFVVAGCARPKQGVATEPKPGGDEAVSDLGDDALADDGWEDPWGDEDSFDEDLYADDPNDDFDEDEEFDDEDEEDDFDREFREAEQRRLDQERAEKQARTQALVRSLPQVFSALASGQNPIGVLGQVAPLLAGDSEGGQLIGALAQGASMIMR